MTSERERKLQKIIPPFLFIIYLLLHIFLSLLHWSRPFELFNLILLTTACIIAILLYQGKGNLLLGSGTILLVASHGLIGQRLAPDALTSGAILLTNILILYVGIKIFESLPLSYFTIFVASYFLLFFIFIVKMDNAEAIFLLALMGLAATAWHLKLFTYFWALVIAFSFCQPYAWQAALILFFLLKIIFSIPKKSLSPTLLLFLICGLSLVFFVLLPVLVLILEEDPRNIVNMLKIVQIRKAIVLTAITATISTGILVLFCTPFAYAVTRLKFYGKAFLLSIIDIPIIIPQSAAGIALLRVFGKHQFLGEFFFNTLGIRFDATVLGVCLAQVFVSMPFIVKGAIAAFENVPPALEQSARTLGASPLSAFFRVSVPLASRGVFIGALLAWARAAGEFGAVLFIAPYPETAPVTVYNRFTSLGLVETAPLVTTLLLFSIAMFFLLQLCIRMMPRMYKPELT
jgi:molybdate/tungstate transport system permease protein